MDEAAIINALRASGARFAFLHGSRAAGTADDRSDIDVAAWWGSNVRPAAWQVEGLAEAVDLVVLDDAPLWLAGRIAQYGRLLFDDDPPSRVAWQGDTRLQYLDELPPVAAERRGVPGGDRSWSTLTASSGCLGFQRRRDPTAGEAWRGG